MKQETQESSLSGGEDGGGTMPKAAYCEPSQHKIVYVTMPSADKYFR